MIDFTTGVKPFGAPGPEGATSSVELEPPALLARLAALVPPPRRHLVRCFGVLSPKQNRACSAYALGQGPRAVCPG